MAKIQHLNLKSPSNKVEILSAKNLTAQINFFVNTKQMGLYTY